ncbi:28S ribosomal protein S18c, mitochondrial isoform X4 [Carlito syrichta]|uniref:28S ribosomal protein S18c, mitochondrial isoform X4 n=1 Tax=Carlito syrichta TaxID=1868482 RepID=A0A3Q0E8J2_CARSF|nr:28S ribosomal protein S18c, mitochondrial isoform X4 [Carlito syrichta]
MAAVVMFCRVLGRKRLARLVVAAVGLTHPGTHTAFRRSCSQFQQVTSNEDLVCVVRNKKKSRKQLSELR